MVRALRPRAGVVCGPVTVHGVGVSSDDDRNPRPSGTPGDDTTSTGRTPGGYGEQAQDLGADDGATRATGPVAAPDGDPATTEYPTTGSPTTEYPTTGSPTTGNPTTGSPTTGVPAAQDPPAPADPGPQATAASSGTPDDPRVDPGAPTQWIPTTPPGPGPVAGAGAEPGPWYATGAGTPGHAPQGPNPQPGPYGAYPQPQPGWGPAYPPPRPTNGMAIASLVLGILWLYWVGSILALVFGYIAKRQIAERGEQGGGLATAGIVLGWIGVGLLILAIVFFVGFAGLSIIAGNF
ncbi:hypothetical protein AFB00_01685 [Pseudonocardia sp. HH130630-07]|nr:hypothetical protein AFB00_01685 [Pseudonocardia sp. HH130630-07]